MVALSTGSTVHKNPSGRESISAPVQIQLNPAGLDFFLRNEHKLGSFSLTREKAENGYRLQSVNAKALQQLLRMDLLKQVSMTIEEAAPVREAVTDLGKLLMYGMVYRQFADTVLEIILDSAPIKRWNRKNPKQQIHIGSINNRNITEFLKTRTGETTGLSRYFQREALSSVAADSVPDMKKAATFCGSLLDHLNKFCWFFFSAYRKDPGIGQVIERVKNELTAYLSRMILIDHTALVLIELLQQIELESITSAAGLLFGKNRDIFPIIADPVLLAKLRHYRKQAGGSVHLSFRFEKTGLERGLCNRMKITLASKEASYRNFSRKLHRSLRSEKTGKTLGDYYKDQNEIANLGFHYIRYLKETCERQGLRFDSFVNHIEDGDFTVIHLLFDLRP